MSSGQITFQSNESHPLTSMAHRQARALSYPEESEMGLFFAVAIPLDDPVSTKSISVAFFFEANYELPTSFVENEKRKERSTKRRLITRKIVYTMLESKFESLGFPGRQCLLRTICETTRAPLLENNGLLGSLMSILFKPSYSIEEEDLEEYSEAEVMSEADCAKIYTFCPIGIYDYITAPES